MSKSKTVNRTPNTVHRKEGIKTMKKGFTLIEILLVVVILGTLAAMVFPRLTGRSEQAKITAARADIDGNIATALKLFELDNGFFPTTEQGLDALLRKPDKSPTPKNWNGPYLEKQAVDPWGRNYVYKCPGTHGFDYDLYSLGRDDKENETDITNWQ